MSAQDWTCSTCLATMFAARFECWKCGQERDKNMITADDGSEWPQDLKDFFDKDVFMNPKKYGLVKVKKPFTNIRVLRLPEEVGVEEELRYSELHPGYQGEEWAPSTPTFLSDIWDFREMSEDMDLFLKDCEQKEELLRLQARSPLPSGEYFVPDQSKKWWSVIKETKDLEEGLRDADIPYEGPTWEEASLKREEMMNNAGSPWYSNIVYYEGERTQRLPPGVWGTPILDDQDRVCTIVVIKKKGHKFCLAESSYGDIYIDLKFTSYIPDVGEHSVMLYKKKALGKNAPFVCKRIIH